MIGEISIKLQGATFQETERCRHLINTLFAQGVFHLRNGSATLHFDYEGILQEIETNVKKWRRSKPEILSSPQVRATIETIQN